MFADRVEYNRASSVSYFHSTPVALTATDRILFLNPNPPKEGVGLAS